MFCLWTFLQPSAFAQRLGYNPLQLPVDTAELIGSPFLDGIHGSSIDTQHKTLGR